MSTPLPFLFPALSGLAISTAIISMVALPAVFPYSDAVFTGLAASAIGLGVACLIPDAWLHSRSYRLAHAFQTRHKTSIGNAQAALALIDRALALAANLRAYEGVYSAQNKPKAEALIAILEQTASRVFHDPQSLRLWQAPVQRSTLVLEGIESKAKLMRKRVSASYLEEAETHMRTALNAALAAFETAETTAADSLLTTLDTTAQVAADFVKG